VSIGGDPHQSPSSIIIVTHL